MPINILSGWWKLVDIIHKSANLTQNITQLDSGSAHAHAHATLSECEFR